ncbi:Probable amino acid permease 7 [Linum grandiflorum]
MALNLCCNHVLFLRLHWIRARLRSSHREIKGSINGTPAANYVEKTWLVFQAIGDIAFAYPYTLVLLEIQDTLKSPPAVNKTMKKASGTAISITTSFFLCCGCLGYATFGNDTPGNLLTGSTFHDPYRLVDIANACVVLHLVGGYQMYSQPVYAFGEGWLTRKFPESGLVNSSYKLKLCGGGTREVSLLRLCFRTAYVAFTTAIAMLFPYFNQVLGVLGGLYFWPLVVHFPVEMYLVQRRLAAWTTEWILLRSFSFACLLVSFLAFMGSVQGLFSAKFG